MTNQVVVQFSFAHNSYFYKSKTSKTLSLKNIFSTQIDKLTGKKILLALSGGLDSVVLAHLLLSARLPFATAHANFGLRGEESDADEIFVTEFARANQLEIFVKKFETSQYKKTEQLSTQEAARELRYIWFEELLQKKGFDLILTAHHLDDSLETFLINLSRGTGIDGLLGIPQERDFIFRPMAEATRQQILNYAVQNNLKWREDSSNQTDAYLRNRIRHHLVPQLKKLHPTFDKNFLQTLSNLKQTSLFVETEVNRFKKKHFQAKENGVHISIQAINQLKQKAWWLHQLFSPEGFTDLKALENLLIAQPGKMVFSDKYRLVKDRLSLILTPLPETHPNGYFWIEETVTQLEIPLFLKFSSENVLTDKSAQKMVFDKDKLKFPLKIRRYQQGDYFYPSGMIGRKKLSKFFKDEKFSIPEKENSWVITSNMQIICVVGKRADRRFTADENTKNFYTLTVRK